MQELQCTLSSISQCQDNLLQKRVRDLTFVAFDTEATGRHPIISGILEVSGIKFKGNGEIIGVKTQLINPQRVIPPDVIAIHGINDEMVADQPTEAEVIPDFVRWMQAPAPGESDSDANVFVAHNSIFDVSFLQVALTRLGLALPANPVLDTLMLSRQLFSMTKNHRLKTLVEHLGYDDGSAVFHRAEADSKHAMTVFLEMLKMLGENCTLQDLIELGGVNFFSSPFEEIVDFGSSTNVKVQRIGESISSGNDLFIHYRGHGVKFRQVTPLSVLYSSRRYYLRAYCHAAGNERTFRVNRISTLELVDRMQVKN